MLIARLPTTDRASAVARRVAQVVWLLLSLPELRDAGAVDCHRHGDQTVKWRSDEDYGCCVVRISGDRWADDWATAAASE